MEVNGHIYKPAGLSPGAKRPVHVENDAGWTPEVIMML